MTKQFIVIDRFYGYAAQLRQTFAARFADPLTAHNGRFVWDYWHVPGEYTHLRTPAFAFFPPKMYQAFHRYLVEWGRVNLGCHDISPPWLSCYVEGCRQNAHTDVPHGPLAFVYSLTPRQLSFTGGETFIHQGSKKMLIPSRFNRLLVFNPALRHGVKLVRGTHDPRLGRLVVHGWFVNPRPFWYGPLTAVQISRGIEAGLSPALKGELKLGRGLLSLRLSVDRQGRVRALKTLVNTLDGGSPGEYQILLKLVRTLSFASRRAGTTLTLPLQIN